MSSRASYRLKTWLCETYDSTKTYLSQNECVAGSFRDFTFPHCSTLLLLTCRGTDRCRKKDTRSVVALPQMSKKKKEKKNPLTSSSAKNQQEMHIQHKALPNAEVNVLPQDNNVNVVAVVVVCLFIA